MPDWEEAYVPDEKLTGYLVSETHAVGKWKAQFFRSLGFEQNQASMVEEELLPHIDFSIASNKTRSGS